MERAIRQTKREIVALKQYDTDEARELLTQARDKLRKQSKAYSDFCRENKLREREWSKTIPQSAYNNSIKHGIIKDKELVFRDKPNAGKFPTSDEEIQDVLSNELSGVKMSSEVKYNPRIRSSGKTVAEYSPIGTFKKVKSMEIGKQSKGTREELIDTLLHEELEARMLKKLTYAESLKLKDSEVHPYINKVIKKFFEAKGLDYDKR